MCLLPAGLLFPLMSFNTTPTFASGWAFFFFFFLLQGGLGPTTNAESAVIPTSDKLNRDGVRVNGPRIFSATTRSDDEPEHCQLTIHWRHFVSR